MPTLITDRVIKRSACAKYLDTRYCLQRREFNDAIALARLLRLAYGIPTNYDYNGCILSVCHKQARRTNVERSVYVVSDYYYCMVAPVGYEPRTQRCYHQMYGVPRRVDLPIIDLQASLRYQKGSTFRIVRRTTDERKQREVRENVKALLYRL